MNDAEKLRDFADLAAAGLEVGGFILDNSEIAELRAIADRIEKLERLIREMSKDVVVWNDDDDACYCVSCQAAGEIFEDRIVHGADCPVSVARRLGVVK